MKRADKLRLSMQQVRLCLYFVIFLDALDDFLLVFSEITSH
jgi:hypothetical protein